MPAPRHSWGARGCGKAHRGHQPKEARLCTRSHSCRRTGHRHYGNHIEAMATGNASLPLVALGPESSGSGPTLALARIHAGAPAQLGRPAGAVKHTEAINLKRPAFALDHIHAGAPAWPVRPPLRQSYRG
ncbi:hypothetical protein NDU88_000152 [Pleurodeles waltl]|uniref:Uncharacterized protein n=1 Tax=Pleurodeles waltl TaxID=8319 RepID=A0AAV7TEX7_PLEWA|nr:hypothetical protein NDU88_000152 [Pleurodeles waltl]